MAFAGTKDEDTKKTSKKDRFRASTKKYKAEKKKQIAKSTRVEPKGQEDPNIWDRSGSGIKTGLTVDPGLVKAKDTYTPPKKPTLDTTNRNEQYYKNLGITDPRQLAAQSMMDAGITNLSGYTGGQFGNQAAGIQQAAGLTPLNIQAGNLPPPLKTTTEDDDGDDDPTTKEEEEKYDATEDFWDEKNNRWDIRKARKNIGWLQRKTGRKISHIRADGTIIFADEIGGQPGFMKLADALSRTLDKVFGFNPEKAFGDMGDTGKAALFNKIGNMSKGEFQDFLNRKGNLDRILGFAEEGGAANMNRDAIMAAIKNQDPSMFANLIKGSGGEGFDKALLKIQDPQRYWEKNPPRTQDDLEQAARAGISYIEGYGPVARPESTDEDNRKRNAGISTIPTDPTPDPTPTNVPDFVLKRQYMPNFTPSYTGGPEQMQIAGGYYDPVTKKWIGSPWGTQNQYQFPTPPINRPILLAEGGIVGTSPLLFKNQGGMANDGGIKSFKKYGY